jgi:hypothetical protein
MAEAGWVPEHYEEPAPAPRPSGWELVPHALFADLTPDEVDEVVEYVKLIKRRRQRRRELIEDDRARRTERDRQRLS